MFLFSLNFLNAYSQTKFWELVDIDKQKQRDEIDVQLMAINDKGTIIIMSELISTLGVEQTLVMYRSFDNGKTWQSLTSKTEGIAQLKQQCILTAHDSIFYLTFGGGYMRSDNNGKTWNKYKNEQSLPNYEGNHWFVDSDTRLFQYYGLVTASHRTNKGWEPVYNSITPNGDTTRFIYYGNKVALAGIPSFQSLPNLMRTHCTINRQIDYVSNQNWDDCNRSANQGMFVSKVFSSNLSCKSLYTILPFNNGSGMSQGKLFSSKDTGRTFQYIKANNNNLFKTISTILPILDENQIFIYAATNTNFMNATTHYYRTKDRGYTWEQLEDPFGSINSIAPQSLIYAKDGTIFLGTSYGLYRGKEKVDTNTPQPNDPCANTGKKIDIRISGVPLIAQPNQHTC